jgi:hypothetical protein
LHWFHIAVFSLFNDAVGISDRMPIGSGHGMNKGMAVKYMEGSGGGMMHLVRGLRKTTKHQTVAEWIFDPDTSRIRSSVNQSVATFCVVLFL